MAKEAAVIAIVGRANVGKSSLFNSLIGRREAIVAKEAGTTRDKVTAKASYAGKDFWLLDTAGAKAPEDEFELTIQEQITEATNSADLIIMVVDATTPLTDEDRRLATKILKTRRPVVLVVNKIDVNRRVDLNEWQKLGIKPILPTSTTQNSGIEELLSAITTGLPLARISEDRHRIRMALLGRPNVGKSSLFNALGAKQQAVVSPLAGTTRDINRIVVSYRESEIELLDTGGIRRSGKIERGAEQFSVLRALSAIELANIGAVLVDATELNTQLDQKIASLVKMAGKGLILVVSKWDQAGELTKDDVAARIAADFAFVPWAPLVFTSAVTGENVTKIFELALKIAMARHQKFKTSELNNWLHQATTTHEPAGLRGQLPKLKYIVQEEDMDYPSFKIFGSHTKALHWSYKRYLERQFREQWPLEGTPLKFWFIEKQADGVKGW